jgi:phosphocarrier protein
VAEREIRIQNKLGLHARAAARFATTAGAFASDIYLRKDEIEVNGKSIMGIMMLAAAKGTDLVVRAEGPDAEQALDALEALVNNRFGEDQ